MSQIPERKSRFQLSKDIQEEFVNGIAQTMLFLTQNLRLTADALVETPFCPTTGREYGGPNMLRLILTSIEKGYRDDRWLTFKQIQHYQDEHPEQYVGIKKGLHGVRLLRPEEIFFTVAEDGKWKFHSQEEARAIEAQRSASPAKSLLPKGNRVFGEQGRFPKGSVSFEGAFDNRLRRCEFPRGAISVPGMRIADFF